MFGYVVAGLDSLPEARRQRFRAFYCGLCHVLRRRHGLTGSATLSYDMTFLALLLNALFEPSDERTGWETCLTHPLKPHEYVESPVMDYAADMNLALAYHKLRDNWLDDRSLPSAAEARMLRAAYKKVSAAFPGKCEAIECWLDEIHRLEKADSQQVDLPVNATGRMLGELFVYPRDALWAEQLRAVGDGLGRFIYFMDAYEDLEEDMRKSRYNPLRALHELPDYEEICRDALMMMAADAAQAFEALPILLDADIARNILYSGIWSKYAAIQKKRGSVERGTK